MRIGLFVAGRNFYTGWRDATQGQRIDFEKMNNWIVESVGGTQLIGAYYFTAIDANAQTSSAGDKLASFLDILEVQPGFQVVRSPRRQHRGSCGACGAEVRLSSDCDSDAKLIAESLRLAAVNGYDAAVFIGVGVEHLAAIEAVQSLGKPVYVASWGASGTVHRVLKSAFKYIDLMDGLTSFEREGTDDDAFWDDSSDDVYEESCQVFLEELRAAEKKFEGGYVGLGYFITKWRSAQLSNSPEVRRRILDDLIEDGDVEMYDAVDGAQAIRATSQ